MDGTCKSLILQRPVQISHNPLNACEGLLVNVEAGSC